MFLISVYGALLAQRAFYLALHSSLWASDAVNYDYIVTNSINCMLIGSRYIPNGAHSPHTLTIVGPIWPMFQNISKTLLEAQTRRKKLV